jgi:hypothetical protein
VVFADTERVQTGLVGTFDFRDQVAKAIGSTYDVARSGVCKLRGETVECLDVKVIDACARRRIQEF